MERDGHRCRLCGKENSNQVHHLIPRKRGGTEEICNPITLCGRCHTLISPIPDRVVSKLWKMRLDRVNLERQKVREAMRRFVSSKKAKTSVADERAKVPRRRTPGR